MLVYYREPMGVLHLSGYRIYGRGWHRSPIDIPYELYAVNKSCLIDATYRAPYLRKHFGPQVSDIAFTVKELKALPRDILRKLASEMGLIKRRGPRRDLKSHDVPRSQKEFYQEIMKALQDVT